MCLASESIQYMGFFVVVVCFFMDTTSIFKASGVKPSNSTFKSVPRGNNSK